MSGMLMAAGVALPSYPVYSRINFDNGYTLYRNLEYMFIRFSSFLSMLSLLYIQDILANKTIGDANLKKISNSAKLGLEVSYLIQRE